MQDFNEANQTVIELLKKTGTLPAGLNAAEMDLLRDAADREAVDQIYRGAIEFMKAQNITDPNIAKTKAAWTKHGYKFDYAKLETQYSGGVVFPEGGIELSDTPLKQDPPMSLEAMVDLQQRVRDATRNLDPRPQPRKRDPLTPDDTGPGVGK